MNASPDSGSDREQWGSRFGFVMATAGFAVGLGNIWRFPYLAGENGGGAFLIVYVAFAVLIGIPLMTAEISLGRKSRLSPIAGMRKLTGSSTSPWNLLGWIGVTTAVLIHASYLMLVAWVVGYFGMMLTGQLSGGSPEPFKAVHAELIANMPLVFGLNAAILLGLGTILVRGLKDGLERVAKIAMPLLFVLLIVLVVRSLTLPGGREGLIWYLKPDFSALTAAGVLAALGQAFFSIGIGMAAAFGFGSYLDAKDSDIPGNAVIVVGFDTSVAVVAGLMIFPALFAFDIPPDSGPGLLFVTMPNVFGQMPGGYVFGIVFFALVTLAAMTSLLAVFEVLGATLRDSIGMTRRTSIVTVLAATFVLAVPIVLSQGPWSHMQFFGRDIFALADHITGSYMLGFSGFLIAVYVAVVWGWKAFRDETNVGAGRIMVNSIWMPFVSVLIPLAVGLVLLAGFGVL